MTATIAALPRRAIRAMTEDELPAAAKLLHRCWHDAYRRQLPPRLLTGRTEDYWVDYLGKRLSRTWLAWIGDRPAGLVSVTANCVDDLWVARRYRRRGLAVVDQAEALGFPIAIQFTHFIGNIRTANEMRALLQRDPRQAEMIIGRKH